MLTVSICFAAVASSSTLDRPIFSSDFQHINNLHPQLISIPIVVGASLHSNSTQPLNQPTRLEIYSFIKANPGVHFRGICIGLGLSVGVVQYHLEVLGKSSLIASNRDGLNKRYFEANTFTKAQMQLISLVRHHTTAEILRILSENTSGLHRDIAHSLGISSQALTWQMNQLKTAGLVSAEKVGVNVIYSLKDAGTVRFAFDLTKH